MNEVVKKSYLVVVLGVFAAITATLIAWPAIAYLGGKLL
jgi:hypothetical protein